MKKILFLAGIILILLGGCDMKRASIKENGQNMGGLTPIPEGTTWENIGIPTEGVDSITDEFSGSKWIGQVGTEKYQMRFNSENNICKIYRWMIIEGSYQKWDYEMTCLRKYENDKIIFDFKPYIDYAESYSMEKCWVASYSMFKEYYEDSKKIFETATDLEIKKKAKKQMEKWASSMKKCETFESFKKMEKVDEWFMHYKKYHAQRAAGLKAINPITAILSADKKTLTVKKMLINIKNDGTAEYAENVVFNKE